MEQSTLTGIYDIRAQWDSTLAFGWPPTAGGRKRHDVPGLVAEADSPKVLVQRRFPIDSKILSTHTASAVLRQAGITKRF